VKKLKIQYWISCGLGVLLCAGAASGQAVSPVLSSLRVQTNPGQFQAREILPAIAAEPVPAPSQILRTIDDTALGNRWLLVADMAHRGGPATLIREGVGQPGQTAQNKTAQAIQPGQSNQINQPPLVVHAGDRLIVEENTAQVEARLGAVALGPGWAGSPLNARLTIGGSVVRVKVLAPGRVALEQNSEVRP
jgi:hypothetical protein